MNKTISKRGITFFLAIFLLGPFSVNSAFAHRFNVVLVIPMTGEGVEAARQYRQGFMLATTERDAHADEESDGHLGGLDSYVSVVDARSDGSELARIVPQTDIVTAFGSDEIVSRVEGLLAGKDVALLKPGQSPFSRTALPGTASFISTFEAQEGSRPSAAAAQGYNAARRIDAAVRAQGAADDRAALLQNFAGTASEFAW